MKNTNGFLSPLAGLILFVLCAVSLVSCGDPAPTLGQEVASVPKQPSQADEPAQEQVKIEADAVKDDALEAQQSVEPTIPDPDLTYKGLNDERALYARLWDAVDQTYTDDEKSEDEKNCKAEVNRKYNEKLEECKMCWKKSVNVEDCARKHGCETKEQRKKCSECRNGNERERCESYLKCEMHLRRTDYEQCKSNKKIVSRQKHENEVRRLLNKPRNPADASVDFPDVRAEPLLCVALKKQDKLFLEMLLESVIAKRSDLSKVTSCSFEGKEVSPLHIAVSRSEMSSQNLSVPMPNYSTRVAEMLIASGSPQDILDSEGRAPLHNVVAHTLAQDMLKAFIRAGANLDVIDADGRTPLHLARMGGLKTQERLLRHNGAKLDIKDRDGKTPLGYPTKSMWTNPFGSADADAMLALDEGMSIFQIDDEKDLRKLRPEELVTAMAESQKRKGQAGKQDPRIAALDGVNQLQACLEFYVGIDPDLRSHWADAFSSRDKSVFSKPLTKVYRAASLVYHPDKTNSAWDEKDCNDRFTQLGSCREALENRLDEAIK